MPKVAFALPTLLSLCGKAVEKHCQLAHTYMSRYGTPASELGRLAIGGSSTSSSGDMPVTTRAMRRGQASGSSARQSSSSTGAGPSRNTGRSSTTLRGAQTGRRAAGNGGGGDSDDDDDSSSEDDSGNEEEDAAARLRGRTRLAALEIAAALDAGYQSPRELQAADARDNPQRRLADAMASLSRDEADYNTLRGVLTQAEALHRVQANFRRRFDTIRTQIEVNVTNASIGLSVAQGLRSFRIFSNAIDHHIGFYQPRHALPDNGHALVGLLLDMLTYITEQDEDMYAQARVQRAQYAGGGNTGNIFRVFVMEHVGILEVFRHLPEALLRGRRNAFLNIGRTISAHGHNNGDRAQFQLLLREMQRIFESIPAE